MKNTDLTISEIKALYFDDNALMLSPYTVYRYEHRGDRFYYYLLPAPAADAGKLPLDADVQRDVRFAVGVTTLTRKTIPQDEYLTKWIAGMGYEAAIKYRDERGKYGSLMHTIFAQLLVQRKYDLSTLEQVVCGYCKINRLNVNEQKWVNDLMQDILAFAQWLRDYDVKPLGIELTLVSPTLRVAGTLDLFCEMNHTIEGYFGEVYKSGERKGEPKQTKQVVRRLTIVDFKSGRESTGGAHNAVQLATLRVLLREAYPQYAEQQINLYNWNPKDWRKTPSYTLTDQCQAVSDETITALAQQYYAFNAEVQEKLNVTLHGVVDLDAENAIAENITILAIKDMVQDAVDKGTTGMQQYPAVEDYLAAAGYEFIMEE